MDEIENLYRDYWQCMISKDIPGLDSMMTDDYTLRHMTGLKQSKEEFFNSLMSGELNYYSAEHDEIRVEIHGDKAAMIGRSRVVAAVYGGGKRSWKLQGDFTLRCDDGVWKLSSSRVSMY